MKLFIAFASVLLLLCRVCAFIQPRLVQVSIKTHRKELLSLFSDPVDDAVVAGDNVDTPIAHSIPDPIDQAIDASIESITQAVAELTSPLVVTGTADVTNTAPSAVTTTTTTAAVGENPAVAVPAVAPPRPAIVKAPQLLALEPALPDGTSYIMCSSCKAAYLMTDDALKKRSLRVKCMVCDKTWFQTSERLLKTDNMHHLQPMNDEKVAETRSVINERQFFKSKGIGIFIGNLPYTYEGWLVILILLIDFDVLIRTD